MAQEEKKVSFGFSKTIKKSALQITPRQEEKKVDYIECLDEKAIRIVGGQDEEFKELVIPMLGSKTWRDRIVNQRTDSRTSEPDAESNGSGENCSIIHGTEMDVSGIKKELSDETENLSTTLEQQAAREIIQDLGSKKIKVEDASLVVPIAQKEMSTDKRESTLEDYEQIPVSSFGLAVLRGMGWQPGKGIGKNEKLFAPSLPELRPRGMGLGADKPTRRKRDDAIKTTDEERLKIEKGSFVKVTTGKYKSNYGLIEGFDDGDGRLIVKMALSGESLSLNENIIEAVTKAEYGKNSKLLNNAKFEEYMEKTDRVNGADKSKSTAVKSDGETSEERAMKKQQSENNRNVGRSKKMKKRSKSSSDDSSSSSSSSDDDRRRKKLKKWKKSHRRDGSAEGSRKKNKRKDKEREKSGNRTAAGDSQCWDRRKHKKRDKLRSRSSDRR